ncbi:MAG TPA: hypothetical protein VFL79_08725 [Terriglobia bacterium]|nr:hypothetical protein [Terriglobia bacterium]
MEKGELQLPFRFFDQAPQAVPRWPLQCVWKRKSNTFPPRLRLNIEYYFSGHKRYQKALPESQQGPLIFCPKITLPKSNPAGPYSHYFGCRKHWPSCFAGTMVL